MSYTRPDHRSRAARAQGFPARSVFKLEEIDQRLRLLRPGQRVIDLGAAPGSWSLYASGRLGPHGRLVSVDLKPIEQQFAPNVTVIQADAFELSSEWHAAYAPYDVVLSDMAPNTGGDKFQNAARSFHLFMNALGVAEHHGAPGSSFVGKLFMGEDFAEARSAVANQYRQVKTIKPEGTRKNSVEVFLIGLERTRNE